MNEITQQDVGEKLLFPLFRSLSAVYKKKYFKAVWEQFENNIRAASYTAKLSTFLENMTRTLPISLEQQFAKDVMSIVGSGMDRTVLTWLRDETTYLTLIARMKNEERKEQFENKIKTEE